MRVTVPYSERRHRLRGDELDPVKGAIHRDLLRRLEDRNDLPITACLFRVWYRMETYCRNKPAYPPHEKWSEIEAYLDFGTVTPRARMKTHDRRQKDE